MAVCLVYLKYMHQSVMFAVVPLPCSVYYPQVIVHQIHQDCQHFYSTHGAVVRGNDIHRAYQMPASPRVPIDAQYLQRYPERVPVRDVVELCNVWEISGPSSVFNSSWYCSRRRLA